MAEKHLMEAEGSSLGDGGLQEHIAHWADVLDRWVQGIDKGMGRQDRGDSGPHLDHADDGPGAEQ